MPDPDARTRRLFFAVWPDAATRTELRRISRRAVRASGGRPVPPDNFHITLAFLGNQPEARFEAIVRAGTRVVAQPMELSVDRFGYWSKPRVFWIGPKTFPPQLEILASDLWKQLEPLGIPRERRPLRPHVTLARKVAAQPEVREPSPLIWKVTEFALIESVTHQRGAVYTVAQNYPL
ncbi:MAG: RNA 2',3'-cyclic phosphodiesterase [Gammaproteobacteria bacterium]